MPVSTQGLREMLDRALPNTGTIGYFILLNDTLLTNAAVTVDATANTFTTATAHGLTTGERVRLSGGFSGSVPAPLLSTVDYFVNVQSTTMVRLHATLADAVANTNVLDITTVGSTVTINAQLLNENDHKEVLIAHEVNTGGYTRKDVTAIGAAIAGTDGKARKPVVSWVQSATGTAIVYRHICFLDGGTAVAGNTTGTISFFQSNSGAVTIAAGSSTPLSWQLGHEN